MRGSRNHEIVYFLRSDIHSAVLFRISLGLHLTTLSWLDRVVIALPKSLSHVEKLSDACHLLLSFVVVLVRIQALMLIGSVSASATLAYGCCTTREALIKNGVIHLVC